MSFQNISDRISKIFYQILISWGIFWTLLAIFGLFFTENDKKNDVGNGLMVLFIFGLFPAILGYFFLNRQNKRQKEQRSTHIEVNLVRLANQKKGRLLVTDVVASLGVTTDSARQMLDELNLKGVFDIEVTSEGVIEYRLHGFSENNHIKS
jgi:hypothetical protein